MCIEILQNSQENTCARDSSLKNSLWHRCFPVNFAKFLRTAFWQNSSRWLLLTSFMVPKAKKTFRSSYHSCSIKKRARNFTKFTGKQVHQIKKRTLAQVVPCEFYEISNSTFFTEHLWTTVSVPWETICHHTLEDLSICLHISNNLYRINLWINYFLIRLSTTELLFSSCLL